MKEWIKAASIRALRTIAQAAIGAGILSILMSISGLPEVEDK